MLSGTPRCGGRDRGRSACTAPLCPRDIAGQESGVRLRSRPSACGVGAGPTCARRDPFTSGAACVRGAPAGASAGDPPDRAASGPRTATRCSSGGACGARDFRRGRRGRRGVRCGVPGKQRGSRTGGGGRPSCSTAWRRSPPPTAIRCAGLGSCPGPDRLDAPSSESAGPADLLPLRLPRWRRALSSRRRARVPHPSPASAGPRRRPSREGSTPPSRVRHRPGRSGRAADPTA